MRIGFTALHFDQRGTTRAVCDYALGNERILGNVSIIFYIKGHKENDKTGISNWSKVLNIIPVKNLIDLDNQCKILKLDALYSIEYGSVSKKLVKSVPLIVHGVFVAPSHGNINASISASVRGKANTVVVPHIVNKPSTVTEHLDLGIPQDAIVVGIFGARTSFDVKCAAKGLLTALNQRDNLWAISLGPRVSFKHPRLIVLPSSSDLDFKQKFINSCDMMLHARSLGETFGLAIAEFSQCNKRIFTYFQGRDKAHYNILGKLAWYYKTEKDVIDRLCTVTKTECVTRRNPYSKFNMKDVMLLFKKHLLQSLQK